MRHIPHLGSIHFIGIGGIGMSGIAEILHNLGYDIQGSDLHDSTNTHRLRDKNIPIQIGHQASNLGDAKVVVVSSAVKPDNAEYVEAVKRGLPVVSRAEMLAELMRMTKSIGVAGSHGKTTTTSMMAQILAFAGLDPTVVSGGIMNAYGTNAKLGEGAWMVVETDESDGSFLKLLPTVAVVTNIDPEHLDHYGSYDKLKQSFYDFVNGIPFYGFGVLCIDHPEVQAIAEKIKGRQIITYGFADHADIRARDIQIKPQGTFFKLIVQGKGMTPGEYDAFLPMWGQHNVQNALATIAVSLEMGLDMAIILSALAEFAGVKRRFTKTGEIGGVTIIDDYGHHPVEIAAVLNTAKAAGFKRVIAIVQPHRYSRVKHLFHDFCYCTRAADMVIVAPIYAAGELPLRGITQQRLVKAMRDAGQSQVVPVEGYEDLLPLIQTSAKPGDVVVCLGAGTITQWAYRLPQELKVDEPKTERPAVVSVPLQPVAEVYGT